jgi:hypothetical protein
MHTSMHTSMHDVAAHVAPLAPITLLQQRRQRVGVVGIIQR